LPFGHDLVPGFDISIEGKDSSVFDAIRPLIASVVYEDDETMASMFELVVINQPQDELGMPADWRAVIDSKAFQEGNRVDLWMGYGGSHSYMGRVQLVKWLPVFGQDGPTTFTIKGFDGRHPMTIGNKVKAKGAARSKKKVAYTNMPDEVIVKKVASKYGYGVDVDTTKQKKHTTTTKTGGKKAVYPTRVQSADMTDWDFLSRLAEINRFDLWVEYDRTQKKEIVHFKRRQDAGSPEYIFTYNGNDGSLLEAEPDFSITEQVTDVEVLVYDTRKKKIERTTVRDTKKSEQVNLRTASKGNMTAKKTMAAGARVRFTAFGQVLEAFRDRPFRSRAEAESFVQQWLKERERDLIIMRGRVVGIETLRPRQIHELAGLGARLDGVYRFTQVRHEQVAGSPYTCSFVANKVLTQDIARSGTTAEVRL
jgi:phage protein D